MTRKEKAQAVVDAMAAFKYRRYTYLGLNREVIYRVKGTFQGQEYGLEDTDPDRLEEKFKSIMEEHGVKAVTTDTGWRVITVKQWFYDPAADQWVAR